LFDNVVIYRNSNNGRLIDVGLLSEALLFYDRVHLLLSGGTLTSLLTDLGADGFDRLMERPELRISYLRENFGTLGNSRGGLKSLNFGIFEFSGRGHKRQSNRDELQRIIERSVGRSAATRKRLNTLESFISFPRVEDDMAPDELTQGARDALDDEIFVYEAIGSALTCLVPGYKLPQGWHFRIFKLNDGSFVVDTNLNLQTINAEYHKTTPPEHSSITFDYLINFIYDSYVGTYLASRYSAEFVHDPLCSSIMRLKYTNILRRHDRSIREIDLFQDVHMQGRNIAGAINAKERSLEEFFGLLDKANKFKDWLRNKNPDESLLSEYHEAVTRETWLDRLPTKGMRWVITTGLGVAVETFFPTGAAIIAAQGVSLVDATVLDRIVKGWKPNQFVNGPLSKFVRSENDR
jgi:hypothetical protein